MDPSRTKDFEGLVSVVCEGFKDSFQAAWGLDTRRHEPTPGIWIHEGMNPRPHAAEVL